jgi:GNAT superfamily N-acetyltransferase
VDGKKELCRSILEELPQWFGIPAAIDDYVAGIETLPTFAVGLDGKDAGFIALKSTFESSCEIYVMGVLQPFHGRGLGRALIEKAEDFAWSYGHSHLYVKTLGPSRPDEHYDKTRRFYEAVGFAPLEELHGVWVKNPCLLMVKSAPS